MRQRAIAFAGQDQIGLEAIRPVEPVRRDQRPADCSDAEWDAHCELAEIYNALVKYRLTDMTKKWHAMRVPGEDGMLTHHYGCMHEEATASNLVRVGVDRVNHTARQRRVQPPATELGKVFFEAAPGINCIMHIHTKAIFGVATQREGLQSLSYAYLMIGGR